MSTVKKGEFYTMGEKAVVDYLRLSITDRCNLNCIYCTPLEKTQFLTRNELLSYEEMVKLVNLFVKAGIRKMRITGGEPLIRRNITGLIEMLKGIKGLEEIAMTTNGVYLKDLACHLKNAGLDRINVSIDTLERKRFESITGLDCFENVWAGIKKSLEIGIHPVKLNVIVMREINDDEILDFARLTFTYPLIVRFIEFFPANKRSKKLTACMVRNEKVKDEITTRLGEITPVLGVKGNGPAEYYKLKNSEGTLGFISSYSKDFCHECNRIRVDCAGRVSPCLFSGYICDLREMLRSSQEDERSLSQIRNVVKAKPGYNKQTAAGGKIEMSSIGG